MKILEMKSDVIYRCIGPDFTNGILACGYMSKPTKEKSQYNFIIDYYSCFLLLSGSGYYYTNNGIKIPIRSGDFVQRIPGVCHSTEIIPDGNWLEFFISFGRTTYDYLRSLDLLPINTPVYKVDFNDTTIKMYSKLLSQLKEASDSQLPYMLLKAQEGVLSTLQNIQHDSSNNTLKESMDEACRLLSSDFNKVILLTDVATAINMSYENFRKQFKKILVYHPQDIELSRE